MTVALVGVVLAVLGVLTGPAPAASAHATLLFTTPAVDGAVPKSPAQLRLVFDQQVTPGRAALQVTGRDGKKVPLGRVTSVAKGVALSASVLDTMPVGEYVVHWEVTARDGDAMIGDYRFAVGTASGLSQSGVTTATKGLPATTALRWLLFLGLALCLGGAVGSAIATRRAGRTQPSPPGPWLLQGAAVGLTASVGLAILNLGDGSLTDGLARIDVTTLVSTTPGRIAAAEILVFALTAALFALRRQTSGAFVVTSTALLEGLRAHPQAASPGLGAAITAVHLAAAAVWVGALIQVVRVCARWRGRRGPAALVVADYARLALVLFLIVVVTGSVAGILLISPGHLAAALRDTGYGRWLLIKLIAVLLIAGLAIAARRHLTRTPNRQQPSGAARMEVVGLISVLAVSGLLTSLAPPTRDSTPLPFPPPPDGPVVGVGSRTGWIGEGVTASNGQMVIRLTTPSTSNDSPALFTAPGSRLTGTVSPPHSKAHSVRFRVCGSGCFVAPVHWAEGSSTVTLRASATGWTGGTTSVTVAWPPKPGADLLRASVRAMRRAGPFTLHEQVTSNTRQGVGAPSQFRLTGRKFLDAEPYGSGVAPIVVVLSQDPHETTLALAYPGEGDYVRLTIDAKDHRILRETLTAPNHLITRTFVYQGADDLHSSRYQ